MCLACNSSISLAAGDISLDDSPIPHVCRKCWHSMKPAEAAALRLDFRRTASFVATADAVTDLVVQALAGVDVFGPRHRPSEN